MLENSGTNPATLPTIAFDKDGNGMLTWSQSDGVSPRIMAKNYAPVGGWGADTLAVSLAGTTADPAVVFDASGFAHVVWRHLSAQYDMMSAKYIAGTGWQSAVALETPGSFASTSVRQGTVVADTLGNMIAIWAKSDGTYTNAYVNSYNSSTGWGSPLAIDNTNQNVFTPFIAMNNCGAAVAIWAQYDGTTYHMWGNIFE